jgi:hypothetical protein
MLRSLQRFPIYGVNKSELLNQISKGDQAIPYENIPLFFNHNEMDARILVFAHERVGDEMEEDI